MEFWETVSFWDKVYSVSGSFFLFLAIGFLYRLSRKEKKALARIDRFASTRSNIPHDSHNPQLTFTPLRKWKHGQIESFCRDYVDSFAGILKGIYAYDGIIHLLEMLDREGDCPSVAGRFERAKIKEGNKDLEATEWETNQKEAYDILRENVSLLDHSLNVAVMLIEKRKKESKDYQMEIGRLLYVSLGHDIGKIPSIGRIPAKDHFLISCEVLNEILPREYPSRDEILTAVRDHHYPSSNSGGLLKILKTGDHQARQYELRKYGHKLNVKEERPVERANFEKQKSNPEIDKPRYDPVDLSWLDVSELLKRIGERINVVENGRYEAFSHSGIVYVYPRLMAKYACDLALEAGRTDMMAYMANQEQMSHLEYAVRCRLNDFIPEGLIGKEYIGRKFQIVLKDGKCLNPGFYIPLQIIAFKDMGILEMENRRKNNPVFRYIKKVIFD